MLKLTFKRQVFLGFVVSLILLLVIGVLSFSSINKLENNTGAAQHTQEVINYADDLLQKLIDAETGMRGFCATDKRIFLDPYTAALPGIRTDVSSLIMLIGDNHARPPAWILWLRM